MSEPLEAPPPLPDFSQSELSSLPHNVDQLTSVSHRPTRVTIPIAREAPHVYSECADIWNPIHTERAVALAAGLPDIILHGTATWGLAAREVVRDCCGGDSRKLRRLAGRFAAMVIPGSDIELTIAGGESAAIGFEVRNAAGELALKRGVALVG